MTYFQRLVVNTLTFISLSVLLPNDMLYIRSFVIAIVASFILSILNTLVKPIIHILSLPLTLLTFGLFSFVINGLMLMMTAGLLGPNNFRFSSLWAAVLVSMVMSFVNSVVLDKQLNDYR